MKFLQIEPPNVELKGFSLNGSFTISNKHEFYSLSYQISAQDDTLKVFPQKGFLLNRQQQTIKVKYCQNNSDQTLPPTIAPLAVEYTLKTEYNKHLLKTTHVHGWKEIPSQTVKQPVEVLFSQDRGEIQKHIKEEILLANTFGRDSHNISIIQQKSDLFLDEKSLQLEINSNMQSSPLKLDKDSQLFLQSQKESPLFKQNKENQLLPPSQSPTSKNQSISFLQFGQSRFKSNTFEKLPNLKGKMVESKLIEPKEGSNNILHSVNNDSQMFRELCDYEGEHKKDRSLEMVVLAILAAFFVALGNNFGRLFK